MSKLAIASRLADELGASVNKAKKFVDDLGGDRSRQLVDDLGSGGSRSIGDFVTPGTLAVGGIGGGALLWRQQDVATARALAEQSSSYNDAVKSIMESNLPPELKQEMVDDATQAAKDRRGGDGSGTTSFIDGIFQDPIKMIFALVLMIVILQYALDGGIAASLPDGSGGSAA
mgnify:CR=1 FL=1